MKEILVIFDMDGTLIRTSEPESGKDIWLEKTGSEWPFKGWWGRKESLDSTIFSNELIKEVYDAYLKFKETPNTLVVLMTGRHNGIKKEVNSLLEQHGLEFDLIKLNDGKGINGHSDTISVKKQQINEILETYSGINEIFIFEDRIEHATEFNDFLTKKNIKYTIHFIK